LLTPRAKRLLGPAVKMAALFNNMGFSSFNLSPEYKLTYNWSTEQKEFDEESVKDEIKRIMSVAE
jgi:hypothetical protein